MRFSLIALSLLYAGTCIAEPSEKPCNIIMEPTWYDLECNSGRCTDYFGGKWILVGTITFKKKCKDAVELTKLHLRWQGQKIDNLVSSLYTKAVDQDKFIPIENNLVCDGIWNKSKQTLMLKFDKKQHLNVTNIFHLVLTVPKELEKKLRHGSFELIENLLPEQFQEIDRGMPLALALDAVGVVTEERP